MKFNKSYLSFLIVMLLAVTVMTVYAGLTFREASASVGSISGSFIYTGGGNGDNVVARINVSGSGLMATCANKAGKTAPGQTSFDINISLDQSYEADRSGRVEGSYHFNLTPDSETAGCPNSKWTASDLQGIAYVTLEVLNTTKDDRDVAEFMCDLNSDGPCAPLN